MAYNLFLPNAAYLIAHKLSGYVGIPCVFGPNWVYQDEVSLYLKERGLRVYKPRNSSKSKKNLAESTMRSLGYALCNALEYCELRKLDWRAIEYDAHIANGYQAEMLNGTFAVDMRKLSASTVNGRVDEFCNFLEWAYKKGFRPKFEYTVTKRYQRGQESMSGTGYQPRLEVESRDGRVRPDPQNLRMPDPAQVKNWLDSVRAEKGVTKHLMCELIIDSAIRRKECINWRVDTLPLDKRNWVVIGHHVEILLKHGTKGDRPRKIFISLKLARKIHEYRMKFRPGLVAKYAAQASTPAERRKRERNEPEQLFISEETLRPMHYHAVYVAWTTASRQPYVGWSPHLGRHYWACLQIQEELERKAAEFSHMARRDFPLDWITGNAQSVITMVIQPQLGHIDKDTTDTYLGWARLQFLATSLGESYQSALEGK